jgi:surface carbohydrate biosynthesis protein
MAIAVCKNNYLKLSIIACSNEPEEKEFYDKIISENDYIFYPKKDLLTSYQLMTSSLLNVCVDSTMGYESFSRGIKTVFISNRSNDLCEDSAKFGWPGLFANFGKFWLNGLNEIKIIEVLNSVYKMDNNDFQKLVLKNSENIMCYDKGNALLKKIVNKILNERN